MGTKAPLAACKAQLYPLRQNFPRGHPSLDYFAPSALNHRIPIPIPLGYAFLVFLPSKDCGYKLIFQEFLITSSLQANLSSFEWEASSFLQQFKQQNERFGDFSSHATTCMCILKILAAAEFKDFLSILGGQLHVRSALFYRCMQSSW